MRTGASGGRLFALVAGQQLDDLLANPVQIGAKLHEYLRCDTFAFSDQAQEDVLRADVVMPELQCLAKRQLENLLRPGSKGNVSTRGLLPLTDDLFDLLADGFQRDAE